MSVFSNLTQSIVIAAFISLIPWSAAAENTRLICEAEKDWPYKSGLNLARQSNFYFGVDFDPAKNQGILKQINLPCNTAPVGTVTKDRIIFSCYGDLAVSAFISRLNGYFEITVGNLDATGSRRYEGRCRLGGNSF